MNRPLKITISIIAFCAVIGGLSLLTASQNHQTNQNRALANSSLSLKSSKESDINYLDNKINLYVFWGDGCPHCESLGKFLSQLPEEYTSLFNLVSFETWNDAEGGKLLKEFGAALKEEAAGVPFFIVGDKVFKGYSERMDDLVKQTIKSAYEKATKNQKIDRSIDAYQRLIEYRKKSSDKK